MLSPVRLRSLAAPAHALEASSVNSGEGVRKCRTEHSELRQGVGPEAAQAVQSDNHSNTDKTDQNTSHPSTADFFIFGEGVGDEHREQRCGGVEDRCESAGNMRLSPDDQAKRNHIVQQTHAEKGFL